MRPRARSVATSRVDVGELQRQAEVHGVVAAARVAAAEDVEADDPDRRGDAPAVLAQVVEGRRSACARGPSARRRPDPRTRAAAARSGRPPAAAPAPCGDSGAPAVEYPGDLAAPEPQLVGGVGRARRLVHGVVDGPARIPHRDDGVAFGRRQHQERVVEGGVAAHSSVLHPTTSASAAPSRGRAADRIEAALLEQFQHARAAVPGRPQLPLQPAADVVEQRPALLEEAAGARARTRPGRAATRAA